MIVKCKKTATMNFNFHEKPKLIIVITICLSSFLGGNFVSAVNVDVSEYSIQQSIQIRGTITDVDGDPVIGASITEKGSTNGTVSDLEGNFELSCSSGADITISYLGYITQTVKASSTMKIILQEDTKKLDEVVVVGYGTMKKSDLTGSVGSISSEKLAARGSTRLEEALQGAIPGVDISQSNSRAGGSFNMQIRGQTSINRQSSPLYVIDGVVSESMDFLNPEDIERVDILKDASSTAIYGSRASAGVIMITTKGVKGTSKSQRVSIGYDGYYGFRKIARMPKLMNSREFMNYRFARFTVLETTKYEGSSRPGVDANGVPHYVINEADLETAFLKRSGGSSYRDSQAYELLMSGSDGYDWTDLVTRTGTQQNHYISISGASQNSNFRLGVGYQEEENVFKHNDYSRYNIKGSYDGKLSKIFEAGFSLNMAYTKREDFSTNSSYSPYQTAFSFNPLIVPFDADGNIINTPGSNTALGTTAGYTSAISPLNDLADKNYTNETQKYNIISNIYFRANVLDNLKLTTTFSPYFQYSRQGMFNSTGVNDRNPSGSNYYQTNGTNSGEIETLQRLNWTWDNQIDYNKIIGDHSFTGMGLFSMYRSDQETYNLKGFGITDDMLSFYAMEKAAGDKVISSSFTQSTLVSGAFRLNYSYMSKYMLTVTARADGSSRFAKGNRWGWFPSGALAWRISEENFLKDKKWLDNLKLRLSYGITGNNNVGDYVTQSTASGPNYAVLDGSEVQAYYPNGLVNAELIWEKVKELDLGIDIGVLNGRINLTADFYNRLSDGQIMNRSVPLETGATTTTANVGSVRNRGIELGIQLGLIRNKDFTWDINVNYSRNWNKILELSNGKTDEVASNRFIGQPLNILRDYTHTDVITDKGVTMHTQDGSIHYTLEELYTKYGSQYKWYEGQVAVNDWNNDGKIDDNDKQIYGCTDPKWIGSLTSNINFKGFDFSIMVYTKQGQWSRSYFHDTYLKYSDRGNQHMSMDFYIPKGTPVIDYKTGDIVLTTETKYGKYPYPNNSDTSAGGYFSDKGSARGEGYQYQKTSFVKIKNICLGYTFPKDWIAKAGMQNLRFYLNIINPFCFTNYEGFDPEWASANLTDGGPASVTYQIGANIKF